MTTYAKALVWLLPEEGGLVDNPRDPGKRTNRGVTQKVYTKWLAKDGRPDADVKDIEMVDVVEIYREEYWLKGRCDRLPWPLALVHFDTCVNLGCGPDPRPDRDHRSERLLQRAAGVKQDGAIGPKTLAAVANLSPYVVIRHRLHYYRKLKHLSEFLPQWVARIEHLMKELEV